jgi:hypothetical protein
MHRFSSIFATVVLLVAVAHAATPTSYIQVAGLVTYVNCIKKGVITGDHSIAHRRTRSPLAESGISFLHSSAVARWSTFLFWLITILSALSNALQMLI